MRRGFKAWCERTSAEYRQTLNLSLVEPLNPIDLAKHLGVVVWTPEDIPQLSRKSLAQLTSVDPSSWSAVTINVDQTNLVILNSAHSQSRLNNSLSHELSHLILNHKADQATVVDGGYLFRDRYDKEQEDEANWLAGALLVPRDGLRKAYSNNDDEINLANQFGVSADLLRWRLRMTGVLIQARRASRTTRT